MRVEYFVQSTCAGPCRKLARPASTPGPLAARRRNYAGALHAPRPAKAPGGKLPPASPLGSREKARPFGGPFAAYRI